MANYCMNKLTVQGDAKELGRFRTAVWKSEEEPLWFGGTVPMPIELEGTQSPSKLSLPKRIDLKLKYGSDNWYDWQLDNWGCKWGPYDGVRDPKETSYKNGTGKLVYHFDTPWGPPTQWLINTSKLFPTLTFSNYCNEEGMGFKGTETIINGKMIKSTVK